MTTSKYEESIKDLTSNDDNKRLKALRFIKNSVIGNKTKKDLYIKLGVVQKLVEYLSLPDTTSYDLKIQSATVLGSIAHGKDENVSVVISTVLLDPYWMYSAYDAIWLPWMRFERSANCWRQ